MARSWTRYRAPGKLGHPGDKLRAAGRPDPADLGGHRQWLVSAIFVPGPQQGLEAPFQPAAGSSDTSGCPLPNQSSDGSLAPPVLPENPTSSAATASHATSCPPAISPFPMSRTRATVSDLWREYTVGLGASPSIMTMYEGESVQ